MKENNQQNEKAPYWMGEDMWKRYIQQGANPKYIKNSFNSTSKTKTKITPFKKGPEETFFQRGHADGQQAHEKMLNITNHQGNAIQKPQ